jgi:hypothetical protein
MQDASRISEVGEVEERDDREHGEECQQSSVEESDSQRKIKRRRAF